MLTRNQRMTKISYGAYKKKEAKLICVCVRGQLSARFVFKRTVSVNSWYNVFDTPHINPWRIEERLILYNINFLLNFLYTFYFLHIKIIQQSLHLYGILCKPENM